MFAFNFGKYFLTKAFTSKSFQCCVRICQSLENIVNKMNASNITDFTVFGEDVFYFNAIKILHGIGVVVCLIAGCIFYGGIVAYERFGGDPAKRSLRNKLIASVFSLPIIFQPFVFGFAYRIIIGPLNIQG